MIRRSLERLLRAIGWRAVRLADQIARKPLRADEAPTSGPPLASTVEVLQRDGRWTTCRTGDGILWTLDPTEYIDGEILGRGVFEPESTRLVRKLVKPGMIVADVGANFGYYTVQLSRLVGAGGHVYAFEPTMRFWGRLTHHLELNNCRNVTVVRTGLSDRSGEAQIAIGSSSATLHWCDERKRPLAIETISLQTFDSYVQEQGMTRLDFIKVDIDGHEPLFLRGAQDTIRRFRPLMLMEFAQLVLMRAGWDVVRLREELVPLDYILCSEKSGLAFPTFTDFLCETMNCAYSANVLCVPRSKVPAEVVPDAASSSARPFTYLRG